MSKFFVIFFFFINFRQIFFFLTSADSHFPIVLMTININRKKREEKKERQKNKEKNCWELTNPRTNNSRTSYIFLLPSLRLSRIRQWAMYKNLKIYIYINNKVKKKCPTQTDEKIKYMEKKKKERERKTHSNQIGDNYSCARAHVHRQWPHLKQNSK